MEKNLHFLIKKQHFFVKMHYGEILYKANRLNIGLCTDGSLISLFCGGKISFFQPHDPTAG